MSKKKFFISAVAVAIGGLLTGWLTAPKSGKQTRGDIKKQATKAEKAVEQAVAKAKTAAKKSVKTAKKPARTSKKVVKKAAR